MKPLIWRLASLALIVQLVGCNTNRVVQAETLIDDESIEHIAGIVCADTNGPQIARITTITKLKNYLNAVAKDHVHYECAQKHAATIELLENVLTTSNKNVCSDQKVSLIELFHNSYVIDKAENQAPPLISIFFRHYALEVGSRCQTTLAISIDSELPEKFGSDINEKLLCVGDNDENSFEFAFNLAVFRFSEFFRVKKYDDGILLWDIIDSLFSEYNKEKADTDGESGSEKSEYPFNTLKDKVDPVTGQQVKMTIKTKSARFMNAVKDHCFYNLRPIYSKLITPIIRLADLGYSNNGERFKIELDNLAKHKLIQLWFEATQFCELLLPVKVYEDTSLEAQDIVVLAEEQARELEQKQANVVGDAQLQPRKELVWEPMSNTMVEVDLLESVSTVDAQDLVKSINLKVNDKFRAFKRFILRAFRRVKKMLCESRVARFFFPVERSPNSTGQSEKFELREMGSDMAKMFAEKTDEELLMMSASAAGFGKSKQVKTFKNPVIKRQRCKPRLGDLDQLKLDRMQATSTQRTQTITEIFGPVWKWFTDRMPSKRNMLKFCGIATIFFALLAFIQSFSLASIPLLSWLG